MRIALIFGGIGLALLSLWLGGAFQGLADGAFALQRAVQDQLASAVRRLRGGELGALAALLALCFAYGFLHAVGPGHGKALIGGYGIARQIRWLPLAGLALLSSLGQSVVAILLVYALILALGWTRDQVQFFSDQWLTPLSFGLVLLVGLWLAFRGWRHIRTAAAAPPSHDHPHHHDHHHHHHDEHCGHAHGPSLEQIERLTNWREAALLMAGIAIRPCSGALFLLIITWSLGIALAGVAGVLAMGLGTACVTITIAWLSVRARESALLALSEGLARKALPVLEITAGLIIAGVAALMLTRALI